MSKSSALDLDIFLLDVLKTPSEEPFNRMIRKSNNKIMIPTNALKVLFFSVLLLTINACFIVLPAKIVLPTPPVTLPTDTPADKITDPDNLIVTFKKPSSAVYLNTFGGVVRAEAKTTVADRKTEMMFSVNEVLKSLPTDSYMRAIGVRDNSPRSVDENRNVFIRTAYIFSIKKEDDGDFHVIIGDLVNGEKVNLMTAEIAALPADTTTKSYALLARSRRQLYERYPDFFEGRRASFIPKSVFPMIAIRGSLFFDTHHTAGQIGSGSAKPETVWELHPVTYLEFQDK
jgi:hypothetical protein